MTEKESLIAIRQTLEMISTAGKNNMERMLGCMSELDKLISAKKEKNDGNIHPEQ